jgi:hypothetical protein
MKPFAPPALLLVVALALPGCAWLGQQAREASPPPEGVVVAPQDPALRAELLAMEEVDQAARRAWDGPKTAIVDRKHTARMHAIVDRHGWPGKALVGEDGATAAWLLVQHADQDRAFQRRCLPLLADAVRRGEASPKHLAYLTDRVAVGEGRPQTYGTQFTTNEAGELVPQPIADEAHVDERRAAVGLGTLAAYRTTMETQASGRGGPVKDPTYRTELVTMDAAAQASMRRDFQAYLRGPDRKARLARFKALVLAKGWPGRSQVGPDGVDAAVRLAGEAREDLPFLRRCVDGILAAFGRNEAVGTDVAELTDRLLVAEGKKQRYGTSFTWVEGVITPAPIEDEAHVDARREALGLVPLAEAVAEMRRRNPGTPKKP